MQDLGCFFVFQIAAGNGFVSALPRAPAPVVLQCHARRISAGIGRLIPASARGIIRETLNALVARSAESVFRIAGRIRIAGTAEIGIDRRIGVGYFLITCRQIPLPPAGIYVRKLKVVLLAGIGTVAEHRAHTAHVRIVLA